MILSDRDILKRIKSKDIITPFKRENLQPSTLDLTLFSKIRVFDSYDCGFVDIKKPASGMTRLINVGKKGSFIIHPSEFILGSTVEKISIPSDVAAKLEGRSSLGRLGLVIHATAGYVDPGFSGTLTLEISNISRLPIKLYANMRIAQLAFILMSSPVLRPYGSKKLGSKYQGQIDPTASLAWKDYSEK